jgi:hypothetical protein
MKKRHILLAIAAMLCVTAVILFWMTTDRIGKGLDRAGDATARIAEAFQKGEVASRWESYVAETEGTNHLQVARLETVETVTRTDKKTLAWDMIILPDLTIRMEVPVEYVFYLDLEGSWEFFWNENEGGITVLAPKIRHNRPAVDVSNLRFTTLEGSLLRREKPVRNRFVRDMTRVLRSKAGEKIPQIRETAREEVRTFVQNWFVALAFPDAPNPPPVDAVYFADETPPETLQNNPSRQIPAE